MHTAYITHPSYLLHDMGNWHPESPLRLRAIDDRLHAAHLFDFLAHREALPVTREQLLRVHDAAYLDAIEAASPREGMRALDPDTSMNPRTLEAAYHATGGAVMAVDLVMRGEVANAFVACRPPGHHATRNQAMGFCVFNNVAVAAAHALAAHGLERVAIVDFDVHHGNGTQAIFWADATVMYCSTHQMPLFPGTGALGERGEHDTIVNAPLAPEDGSAKFRAAFENLILPQLARFSPELIIISAGFDAHYRDPLASLNLKAEDFGWVTRKLMDLADQTAGGRVVSVLEGGYDLQGLQESVAAHVTALMSG